MPLSAHKILRMAAGKATFKSALCAGSEILILEVDGEDVFVMRGSGQPTAGTDMLDGGQHIDSNLANRIFSHYLSELAAAHDEQADIYLYRAEAVLNMALRNTDQEAIDWWLSRGEEERQGASRCRAMASH